MENSGRIPQNDGIPSHLQCHFHIPHSKGGEIHHPIALYNVIFKLITKVLANKLKPLLPKLISKEKIGYVEGCQILDNIILTQELVHSLNRNKTLGMLIQLDMSKAFNKSNWKYIKETLKAFGFHPTLIQ